MMSCDTSDLYFALQDDKFLCATCCIIGSILFTMWVQCRCIGHTGSLRTLLWSAWSRASAAYRTCKLAGGGGLYQLYEPWRSGDWKALGLSTGYEERRFFQNMKAHRRCTDGEIMLWAQIIYLLLGWPSSDASLIGRRQVVKVIVGM